MAAKKQEQPSEEHRHPRCAGCGTRDHGPDDPCPDQPEQPNYLDDSWGDHDPRYDW